MTQALEWTSDSGDGVYIGGGHPKDTNHTPIKTMTFTINTDKIHNLPDYSLTEESSTKSIEISKDAVQASTDPASNLIDQNKKVDFAGLDNNTLIKIENLRINDPIINASGIINAADQSTLEKLGFDIVTGGKNIQPRDFCDGFGLSESNSLAELARWVGGGARHNGSKGEDWQQDGEPQTSSVGDTTVTRTRETNGNAEGTHTRTTVVTKTTLTFRAGPTDKSNEHVEVTTTIVEETEESQPDSTGKKTYVVKQSKSETSSNGASDYKMTYVESGVVDSKGNRTKLMSSNKGETTLSYGDDGEGGPLFPLGQINPNPEDDGAYGGGDYEINHPALDRDKYAWLQYWDPAIDHGEEQNGSGPYTGPTLAGLGATNGGKGTGTWDVTGGPYSGPDLYGLIESMGGTSTGTDWL